MQRNSINSCFELSLTHVELESGMLGIAKKLVKDVIQLWWQNFEKKSFSTSWPKSKLPQLGFKKF
jgi:hypothetical protein